MCEGPALRFRILSLSVVKPPHEMRENRHDREGDDDEEKAGDGDASSAEIVVGLIVLLGSHFGCLCDLS